MNDYDQCKNTSIIYNAHELTNFFDWTIRIKVGLSPSKKICFIWLNERPLKMKKNAYFILEALLVKLFKFLHWVLSHVEKTAQLEIKG